MSELVLPLGVSWCSHNHAVAALTCISTVCPHPLSLITASQRPISPTATNIPPCPAPTPASCTHRRQHQALSALPDRDRQDGWRLVQSHDVRPVRRRVLLALHAGDLRPALPQVGRSSRSGGGQSRAVVWAGTKTHGQCEANGTGLGLVDGIGFMRWCWKWWQSASNSRPLPVWSRVIRRCDCWQLRDNSSSAKCGKFYCS